MKPYSVIILMVLLSCSPKYEVIQSIAPNTYHIVGVKDKEVIIVNNMKLTPGQLVKWRDIKRGKYATK